MATEYPKGDLAASLSGGGSEFKRPITQERDKQILHAYAEGALIILEPGHILDFETLVAAINDPLVEKAILLGMKVADDIVNAEEGDKKVTKMI